MRPGESVFIDSQIVNLLADRSDEDFNVLAASDEITLLMPFSVEREVAHPNTPANVRKAADELLRSESVPLNENELKNLAAFISTLAGLKKPKNIDADLRHAWEANKYGRFFIALDADLLRRAKAIFDWNGLMVMTPREARLAYDRMIEARLR
jgi:hypothetical protein